MNDLKLTPTMDGFEFEIESGSPVLDGGLSTAIYLSLFTGPYWGNTVAAADERYTSRIPEIMAGGVLTNRVRLDVIAEAENALKWMVAQRVVERLDVRAEIPNASTLYLAITLYEPARDDGREFAYGLNWNAQKVLIMEAS